MSTLKRALLLMFILSFMQFGLSFANTIKQVQAAKQSITLDTVTATPNTAGLGQVVTFTVKGTPGGKAALILGDQIPMAETSPGIYVGSYVVPQDAESGQIFAAAQLQLPDGQTQMKPVESAVNVQGVQPVVAPPANASLDIHVVNPFGSEAVPACFAIYGTTRPFAIVTAQATAIQHILFTIKTGVGQNTVQADQYGNFVLPLDTRNPQVMPSSLFVALTATDSKTGEVSKETDLNLSRLSY